MAIGFNIQFRVNPTTQSYVIRLTDTSTGFVLSKGNFVINYPDGSIRHYVDFNTPDISAPLGYVDVVAPTDSSGGLLTGSYTFSYITLDSSVTQRELVKTINFDWIAPTVTIKNLSDSALPEVKFQDTTSYTPSGSFTGVVTSRTFSVAMPSTSAVSGSTPTTSSAILDAVVSANYYEGAYTPLLSTVITYTHTSVSGLTVLLTSVTTKQFLIKRAPTRNELVTRINAFRAIIDGYKELNDTQFEILSEQYDILMALYFHLIERVYSSTLDGSQDILNEILSILDPYTAYTYQSGPISAFYIAPLGSGTVSSVDLSAPTGFTVSGNPVTTAGTLALAFASGYSLPSNTTQATWTAKQNALSGTGFVKSVAGVISYDNSTYLSSITSANVIAALGYTPYSSANPSNYVALGSLSSSAVGLTYTNTTGVFSLTSGYVIPTSSSTATWDTAYTNRITSLTNTGNSGAASITSNVLNIPNYTLNGLGGQASSVNLTSLSTLTYASTAFVKMTNSGTFSLDTNTYLTTTVATSNYVPYSGATGAVTLGTNNITANAYFNGFTSVVASASLITLTIASTPVYLVTGSGGQVFKLPNANTITNGTTFSFNNNQTTGAVIINNNSNTLVVSVPSGAYVQVVLLDNTNAAGIWDKHELTPANVSWSTNTFDYAGSIISATWNGNVVQPNRGGTGQSTYTDGQLLIGNTTGNTLSKATLTAGTGITITNGNGSISIANNSISGTANTLAKFTSATAIGNSSITDTGSLVTINGLNKFIGTTASDTAPLGSELAAVTGTGTNWALAGTNLNVGGYTHTTGDVTPLTTSLAAVSGTYYQITYTITGRTAGSITIAYGGTSTSGITATGNTGPLASSTGVLTITPSTTFDGTVVLSVKSIGTSSASSTFANSSGTSNIEVRASSDVTNIFIGLNAGRRVTTGNLNTFIGYQSGLNTTTGYFNSFIGYNSGLNNTIGMQNVFVGHRSGENNISSANTFIGVFSGQSNITGNTNTFIGYYSGQNNTTGNTNTFIGESSSISNTSGNNNLSIGNSSGRSNTSGNNNCYIGIDSGYYNISGINNVFLGNFSGKFISDGSTANAITNNSIYIGYNTKALASSQTNQIVIGYNSTGLGSNTTVIGTTSTITATMYGRNLIGSTTDDGTNALQVTGGIAFKSLTGGSDRVLYVTSTGVVTAATIGTGLSFSSGTLSATGTASGSIGGSGTSGYVPKFTGIAAIGNSNIQDSGSLITLGSNTYVNGLLGIGELPTIGYSVFINKQITGNAVAAYGIANTGLVLSDVTGTVYSMISQANTQAASFTLINYIHYGTSQGTIGAGSVISNQYGYFAESNLTGATNNFGFYGNIPSGSNRWNIYMNGTANNYLAGSLGIGTTSLTGYTVNVAKNITGSTTTYGIRSQGTVQSDVTTLVSNYGSLMNTAAASFTLTDFVHHRSMQGTIGSGSVVTNQYGYFADSSMIGATNNFGFYGGIPAGTNRWNLYMNGTADNYLSGSLFIGVNSYSNNYNLRITKDITGSTNAVGFANESRILNDVTGSAYIYYSNPYTATSSFTLANLNHFTANQSTFGAGSTVTSQYGFRVLSNVIGATNNYGFYGDIPSGSNRWNIYMNGTANNYMAGNLGIGTTSVGGINGNVPIALNLTGNVNSYAIFQKGTVQSDVTTAAVGIVNTSNTAASSFTLGNYYHVFINQGTIGSGSAITNQFGYFADSSMIGATNNYGFYGNIPSGSNRWNIYMNGTAKNYLNGSLLIGSTTDAGFKLDVNGTTRLQGDTTISSGGLGVGISPANGYSLLLYKNITGATASYGVFQFGNVQSDVTVSASGFFNQLNTQAASFTTPNYNHFVASQGTIGAGSTITNQNGFLVSSTLTGATNNYGFRAAIPSSANNWNLFMDGTANNYLAGSLGIGSTSLTGYSLNVGKNITGATTSYGINQAGIVQSDATTLIFGIQNQSNTQATAFTLAEYRHFNATQGTIGSGSSITTQTGFHVSSTVGGATNNYGFRGAITASTGRYNLYMDGSALNYLEGNLGIGVLPSAGYSLYVNKNLTSASSVYGIAQTGAVQSDLNNGSAFGNINQFNTQAATFTLIQYIHYRAVQGTIGSGSTITGQVGFSVATNLTSATTNYGFQGSIPSGSNRWNIYMDGTAQNYLAGALSIGVTTANASALLQVDSTTQGVLFPRMTTTQKLAISSPATGLVVFDTTLGKLCVFSTTWQTITSV